MFEMKPFRWIIALALLSTAVPLSSAWASNRGFPGAMGRGATSSDESCLLRKSAWLYNNCGWTINVVLPMSVDAAAWYNLRVYGRRTPYASVTCRSVTTYYYGGTYGGGSGSFVYADGRAESMDLSWVPVYSPGDAVYAECSLGAYTTIFSYGWN